MAFLLSLVLTPAARALSFRVGAVDIPRDARRMHKKPTARMGGAAIVISFFASCLLCFTDGGAFPKECLPVFIGGAMIAMLGAVDDIRALKPTVKLAGQITAVLFTAYAGVRIDFIGTPSGIIRLGIFSVPVTVLWMLVIINAFNLIDGIDGLAAGTHACGRLFMHAGGARRRFRFVRELCMRRAVLLSFRRGTRLFAVQQQSRVRFHGRYRLDVPRLYSFVRLGDGACEIAYACFHRRAAPYLCRAGIRYGAGDDTARGEKGKHFFSRQGTYTSQARDSARLFAEESDAHAVYCISAAVMSINLPLGALIASLATAYMISIFFLAGKSA